MTEGNLAFNREDII